MGAQDAVVLDDPGDVGVSGRGGSFEVRVAIGRRPLAAEHRLGRIASHRTS